LTTAFDQAKAELATFGEPVASPPRYQRTAAELKEVTGARTSIKLYHCSWCKTAYRRPAGDDRGCPNGCPPVTAEELHARGVSLRQATAMLDAHGRQRHPSQVRHTAEPVVELPDKPSWILYTK
jgi:hypothetical protein